MERVVSSYRLMRDTVDDLARAWQGATPKAQLINSWD